VNNNLTFLYADISSVRMNDLHFDIVVLASSIQYFDNLPKLIQRLIGLVNPGGEIHILDSPIYSSLQEKEKARLRSVNHFTSLGFEEMKEFYFHHQWSDMEGFDFETLHNPQSLISKLKSRVLPFQSPFPHLVIHI
jgi:ubiquinone/menaquinone biosynthesis C-methylase UbiE